MWWNIFHKNEKIVDLANVDEDIWLNCTPSEMLEQQRLRDERRKEFKSNEATHADAKLDDSPIVVPDTVENTTWWDHILSIFAWNPTASTAEIKAYPEAKVVEQAKY